MIAQRFLPADSVIAVRALRWYRRRLCGGGNMIRYFAENGASALSGLHRCVVIVNTHKTANM